MSDLVERLRLNQGEIFGPTMQEAADEIERLRAQVSRMQQEIEGGPKVSGFYIVEDR